MMPIREHRRGSGEPTRTNAGDDHPALARAGTSGGRYGTMRVPPVFVAPVTRLFANVTAA